MLNVKHVDWLNMGLLLLSLLLAVWVPFHLFLFAYAVLGPLHYLTEIKWLNTRNYFVLDNRWIVCMIVVAALASLTHLLSLPLFHGFSANPTLRASIYVIKKSFGYLLLGILLFSIALTQLSGVAKLGLALLMSAVGGYFMVKYVPIVGVLVNVFVPRLIHVYLFTLLFMIFGNLKSNTPVGWITIVCLLISPLVIAYLPLNVLSYPLSKEIKQNLLESGNKSLNVSLVRMLKVTVAGDWLFQSLVSIRIQIFIAFSYTYHYLNWFSKTTLIGWERNISKREWSFILVVWVAAALLYALDYKTGLVLLFFLSYLHVLLEFPLNVATIKGIFNHCFNR